MKQKEREFVQTLARTLYISALTRKDHYTAQELEDLPKVSTNMAIQLLEALDERDCAP